VDAVLDVGLGVDVCDHPSHYTRNHREQFSLDRTSMTRNHYRRMSKLSELLTA